MSGRRIVRVVVRGRVQGVGFRAFVEDEANLRALNGWVRNRRDGSVETLAGGPAAEIDAFLAAVRASPPPSRVDAVEVEDADGSEVGSGSGFGVLPTV
jgi:acylphosphatase